MIDWSKFHTVGTPRQVMMDEMQAMRQGIQTVLDDNQGGRHHQRGGQRVLLVRVLPTVD